MEDNNFKDFISGLEDLDTLPETSLLERIREKVNNIKSSKDEGVELEEALSKVISDYFLNHANSERKVDVTPLIDAVLGLVHRTAISCKLSGGSDFRYFANSINKIILMAATS